MYSSGAGYRRRLPTFMSRHSFGETATDISNRYSTAGAVPLPRLPFVAEGPYHGVGVPVGWGLSESTQKLFELVS